MYGSMGISLFILSSLKLITTQKGAILRFDLKFSLTLCLSNYTVKYGNTAVYLEKHYTVTFKNIYLDVVVA